MPTNQGERELMLDRQSPLCASGRRRLLEQAQSPLVTLMDVFKAVKPQSAYDGSPVASTSVADFLPLTSSLLSISI